MHNNTRRNRIDREQDLGMGLTVRQRPQLLAHWNACFAAATSTDLATEIRFHARDGITAFISIFKWIEGPIRSPIQWVPEALSPKVKRLKRQADQTTLNFRMLEFMDVYHHDSYTSP